MSDKGGKKKEGEAKVEAQAVEGVVWAEPPSANSRGNTHDWQALLGVLKTQPGRWARMAIFKTRSSATNATTYVKHLGFQAVSRRLYEGDQQGQYAVFARYIGESTSE